MPPRIHERTFRVRHYECDANGHVYNANYVRYMQEAALDASAAAGYDFDRYQAMHRAWAMRGTDIEYLRPLTYGDLVRVKTWVADQQGAYSWRIYELYSVKENVLTARASTEAEFIDTDSSQPAQLPLDLISAFAPADDSAESAHATIPPAPAPPPTVFKTRVRVSWRDVDPAGRVNNAMYLSYINDCGMEFATSSGWTLNRMWEAGFGILVRRQQVEYLREARMDDELEIATWLSDLKPVTALWHFTITRVTGGERLARSRGLYVWINPTTGQLRRLPDEISSFLKPYASAGSDSTPAV